MDENDFKHTISLATQLTKGVQKTINQYKLPWMINQLGCRAAYWFVPQPPKNGGEAVANYNATLDYYMHLATFNRGVLLTPFHNMALIAPSTTKKDIDKHTKVFSEVVRQLMK